MGREILGLEGVESLMIGTDYIVVTKAVKIVLKQGKNWLGENKYGNIWDILRRKLINRTSIY